jgi:Na+/H+ antiporter NhaD/arsenite permease-like protein
VKERIFNIIKKEWLFFIFTALFFVLYIKLHPTFKEIYSSIDWSTIRALSSLLLITTALKISNFFDVLALKIINNFHSERTLALNFILLSIFLSMFLTNDITLFIVVPLTLSLANYIKNDLTKLIIFEAIAVNVGSTLTPIGNPQNIFLFKEMNVSIFVFFKEMFFPFIIMFIILVIFTFFAFPKKKLDIDISKNTDFNKPLFFITLGFFILFLLALEFSYVRYVIAVIFGYYLIFKKDVIYKFDYFLILMFIIMFIDFSMLSKFNIVKDLMNFDMNFLNVFNTSVLLSQIISNVPTAIFMSNFTNNYVAIAYGVNVAGNGLLIASLANIIALRFLKKGSAYLIFHKYSIPYFLLSYILIVSCYLF